jgi:hypothetical protein
MPVPEQPTASVDPRRCPLCGDGNACGIAEGKSTCWCFEATISPETLARVPAEAREKACVCRGCVEGEALTAIGTLKKG